MKKILVASMLASLACSSVFAVDGSAVYKKCIACHGVKAEKKYLGKVPALNTIEADKLVESMMAYKAGTKNDFKMGIVMKGQMSSLKEEDIKAVAEHIQTLK